MKSALLVLIALFNSNVLAFDSPQALQDAFVAAMRANNADGLAACYTADAVNFPVEVMMETGPDAVRQSWQAFFQQYQVTNVALADGHMEVSGDLAAAWGRFTLTVQPHAGGDPFDMAGRYMDVAKKGSDGRWLYIADHASLPLPPEDPEN